MIRTIERGKHIIASLHWVDFLANNIDIVTALNNAPMQIKRTDADSYRGRMYGTSLRIDCLSHQRTNNEGCVKFLSYIRLPMLLGRTYATTNLGYCATDPNTTFVELVIELESKGIATLYAKAKRLRFRGYIDKICDHIEEAARLLSNNDDSANTLLDEEQMQRVNEVRSKMAHAPSIKRNSMSTLEAAVRISRINQLMIIEASAVMPDKHLMTAKNIVKSDESKYNTIQIAAHQLAHINNPMFRFRGEESHVDESMEFHEVALKLGYALYTDFFGGKLKDVMPIFLFHNKETHLRLNIDEDLETIPWEVLHDGKEFISTKMRLSRSLGTASYGKRKEARQISDLGIMLVGSDSRGDLPGSVGEVKAIREILDGLGINCVDMLCENEANRHKVLERLGSGKYNVFHFSGHSVVKDDSPYQSYLELAHGNRLSLHELDSIVNPEDGRHLINLVFLNSCQSGRARTDRITGRSLSLCRVFKEAGIDNVIGMLWNVSDDAAAQVASVFYEELAAGDYADVSEAMRKTRRKVAMDRAWQDGSWLAPVLYT